MNSRRRFGGPLFALSMILLLGAAAVPADKAKDEAKVYDEALKGMKGLELGPVVEKFREWKFGVLDAWESDDPTPKDVGRHNRKKVKFSKKEVAEIFGGGGKFRIVVYSKLVEKDSATMGTIDDMGMTMQKDLSINIERFCVVRVVFKDGALVHHRIWPRMDQSALGGGTFIKRHGG